MKPQNINHLIEERQLERNEYTWRFNYGHLQVFGRGDHRVLMSKIESLPNNYYKVQGSYLTNQDGNKTKDSEKINNPYQLELFTR